MAASPLPWGEGRSGPGRDGTPQPDDAKPDDAKEETFTVICVKCGQQNPSGANYCQSCNTVLPKVPQAADPFTHQPVNERYLQLKEAGDRVLASEWTIEQYAAFLDNISRVLARKEQEIRDIEIPAEALEDFRTELELGYQGIDLYTAGIATMRLYLADRNPAHIHEGLEQILEGNEAINEAMRINRENRRKMEEAYVDSSTMI